jgi:hypothetical protein
MALPHRRIYHNVGLMVFPTCLFVVYIVLRSSDDRVEHLLTFRMARAPAIVSGSFEAR